MKGKSKHILIRNLITICSGLFLVVGLIGTILSLTLKSNSNYEEATFANNGTSYNTNQIAIKNAELPENATTVTMTEAISKSQTIDYSLSNIFITISSSKELYDFSNYCNDTATKDFYLRQKYKLICNIDYSESYYVNGVETKASPFIPIAWDSTGNSFSGIFDGQGYEITNLSFVKLADVAGSSTSISTAYADMQYLGMFCNNTGTIRNLGLIQSTLTISVNINKMSTEGGIANLVGYNNGTVTNCFYKDLRDTIKFEIGISAFGGYQVAGLVFENGSAGTVSNSYIAVSNVLNYTVNDYDLIAEVMAENNGTVLNVYFYDSSISKCTSTEIVYRDNLFDTNNYTTGKQLIGTYVASTQDLRDAFENISGWYSFESYPAGIRDYLKTSINTPIHRGISITNTTATISSTADFLYMYELFNIDNHFATDLTYQITSDIDLSNIPSSNYYYKRVISSTITGLTTKTTGNAVVTLEDNSISTLPTIYNFNPIDKNRLVVTAGVDTYGLFPYVSGTISNLNIVPTTTTTKIEITDIDSTSTNSKGIGALTGYCEKGIINNVNVYVNFKYSQNIDLGEYYLGGIAGLLGGEGTISNSTIGGSIDVDAISTTVDASESTFTAGIGIGGAVGYVVDTYGSLDTILNKMSIDVIPANSNTKYQIGGVCGAGYFMTCNSLENQGNIIIGSTAITPSYSLLYASGVIGRLLGVTKQIDSLTNQAKINTYLYSSATINMVSGVLNADIVTLNSSNSLVASNTAGNLVVSGYKNGAGQYLFWGSSFTNAANVIIHNSVSNLIYTDVINIYTSNGFNTKLNGVYNLNYTKILNTKSSLEANTIDMNLVREYAAVVNVINGSNTANYVDLDTVYNLKNLSFEVNDTISATTLLYGGVVKGANINYQNVRNEGSMTFDINAAITATTLKVFGVLEKVSAGYKADTIYNGSNITITSASSIQSTITNTYVAGICYSNETNFTAATYNEYNPLSSDFDYSKTGTLSNVINNGNVEVIQEGAKTSAVNNINGNIRAAGIVNANYSVVSSAFNLGDVFINAYSSNNKYLDAAGIATLGFGQYAQIKDCANNGTIKNVNMSTNTVHVVSAGILARNNMNAAFTGLYAANVNNPNSQGVIVFTINYGSVISYNQRAVNINKTTYTEPYSNAAGILGAGLCNTINVVNYANIYGSENISGMFTAIDFSKYATEVTEETPVYLSNSINYGTTYIIAHRFSPAGIPQDIKYSEIIGVELDSNKSTFLLQGTLLTVTLDAYYGSCISLINYASNTNAQYINVRYLINMNSIASMIATEIGVPTSVTGATQTMFSAKQNDRYLNSGVVYSPLNNESTTAFTGLFSEKFKFRQAIEGQLTLDTTTYPTDAFLTDYFQFVGYSKINENLLNSIGWTAIAYNDAAERFGENLTALTKLMADYDTINTTNYNSLLSSAFNTSTWVSNCSPIILQDLLPDVLASQDLATLKSIISYLFFESEYKNEITQSLRNSVVDIMVSYVDSSKTDAELKSVLDALMYPELLGKIIAESDTDYKAIKDLIKNNISSLTTAQKLELLNTYIGLLDNNNYFVELFNNSTTSAYYTDQKYTVLTELLDTLDTTMLGEIYTSLDTTSYSTSLALKYALESLSDSEKRDLFYNIFYYSYSNLNTTYEDAITSILSQIDTDTNKDAYFTSEVASTFTNEYFESDTEYVETWNAIKNDLNVQNYLLSRFGYVQDSLNNIHKGIYAKATEYRNTYQSNDKPNGATYTINNDGSVTTTFADTSTRIRNENVNSYGDTQRRNLIRNRFIYTPDNLVSDEYTYSTNGNGVKTYYYGPYVSAPTVYSTTTGNSSSTPTTATMWNEGGAGAPLKGFKLNSNDNTVEMSGPQTVRYVPLFVSLDENYVANLTGGTKGSSYFEFLWNDWGSGQAVYQWVSREIVTTKPDNNKFVLKKDTSSSYTTSNNGRTSSGTTYYYRYYTYDANGNATAHNLTASDTLYYNYSTVGKTTHYGDYYNNLIYRDVANNSNSWNANDVLWGYLTANVITGIYYIQSMWEQNGAFMTAKSSYGVITTEYIDYSLDDLIAVDGSRTKGLSTGTSDDDEITIIKTVLNNYLLDTDEGRKVVVKAVTDKLKTDVYSNYAAINLAYALYANNNTSFINTFMSKIPTTSSSYSLKYSDSSTTLSTYLSNIFATNILPNMSNKDTIIMYSADNRANLKTILKYFYDKDTGYYSYLSGLSKLYNVLSLYNTDEYKVIYDYINDNRSLTESELSSIISTAVDTYINNYVTDYNSLNNVETINNSNASLTGYTLSNTSIELANENYNNVYYSNKFVSEDSTNNYSIAFTPSANSMISVVAKGSGTISDGTKTDTVSNSLSEYKFDGTSGSQLTLTASPNVEIYALNTYTGVANTAQEEYSNITSSGWNCYADNRTISSVSFSSYLYTQTQNSTISIRLLEDASSITVYGKGNSNNNPSYMYYTSTRYITFNNSYSGQSINTSNLNLTAGTILTFTLNTSRQTYIYGIKVNDNIYRIIRDSNTSFHITKNGNSMYRVKPTEGTIISYSSSDFLQTGTVTDLEGNLKIATSDTTLIDRGTSSTYYTYSTISSVITPTYFTNNHIKNNYAKVIAGYGAYDSNAIENYVFDKQYGSTGYTLDTGSTATNLNVVTTFGKYTFNADSTNRIVVGTASTAYGAATFTKKVTLSANSTRTSGSIQFTLNEGAKLFIVAKGSANGNLYISNGSTIYGSYVNTSVNAYEFSLSAGTYYIYTNCSLDIYAITAVLNTDLGALNSNYQNIATKGAAIINSLTQQGYTSSNYANYLTYYNYLKRKDVLDANTNTTTYYDNEVLLLALTQTTDINLYNLFSNNVIVQLLKQSGYKLDEVFGSATATTSTGLLSYIDLATAKQVITTLANANNNLLVEAILKAKLNSTTVADASKLERELVAAYVSTDFLAKLSNNTLTSSDMDEIIEALSDSKGVDYDFIKADNTISTTEFLTLMQYLGVDVATDGYGIFALASSHGIQNGTFIPDNIDLIAMDAKYSRIDGNSYIELTDTVSPSWRDLTGTSTSDTYVVSNTNSVNYAIREEMKQLKLSISTTIFELDLKYSNTYNIYASESQIDYVNDTITYQVSSAYYTNLKSKTSIPISNIEIAESATYTSNLSSITWNVDDANKTLTFENAIVVTAEDTTVSTSYTIIIIGVAIDFNLSYYSTTYIDNGTETTTQDSMNIPYYGATVTFKFTSSTFLEGLDLKNYFYVGSGAAISTKYEMPKYWKFTTGVSNNGIVDSNGEAYISVDVTQAMPQGTKYFTLMFYGTGSSARKSVQIIKNANTAAVITAFGYDGTNLLSSITGSSKTAKSKILFGRAFSYSELTDYESSNFYLYDFSVSDNATVSITATKSVSQGLMTYKVTYVVTSESGDVTNTYYHNLTEVSPYSDDDVYAYLYRDGYTHSPYTESFAGQPSTGESSLSYTSGEANYVAVYFNRGFDYQYRIRYNLNNFYITNRDDNFGASDATYDNGSSILESYGGLTVSVTSSQDPGTYAFEYVYTNTVYWDVPDTYSSVVNSTFDSTAVYYVIYNGEYVTVESRGVTITADNFASYKSRLYIKNPTTAEYYTRTYTFPVLYVVKDYAIDALISRLTFLDESIVLGDTATVLTPGHPLIPTDSEGHLYDATYEHVGSVSANSGVEWTYNDAFQNNTGITIGTTTVNYSSAASAVGITDYYALGTVSDSDLTYYSPTFAIDDYAQIYKYTTLTKLLDYGEDLYDRTVLTVHTNRYIYVPFNYTIGTTTTTEVFLVELEDGTNKWLKVYSTKYDGNDESYLVHEYTTNVNTYTAKTDDSGFTYDGKAYTISSLAGTTNSDNISLYMDYIGNPAEGHFWYISYAVFSEYYLQNGITDENNDGEDDLGAVKYYHVSIIDATNTIYFEVELYASTDFEIDTVYLTISEDMYDSSNVSTGSRQISGYLVQEYEYTEIALTSGTYQTGTYYIQNRDGTYSLSNESYSSTETYYKRGNISISHNYDSVSIASMTQEKFAAGEYYTYQQYTEIALTSDTFVSGKYYTYSDYKAISMSAASFVADTYYTYNNGTYTKASAYVEGTQYYKKVPTYTLASEYSSTETYYDKTDTYTKATTYVEGTQYYKKSATYGLVKYTLRYGLAVLPKGYFYFYLDLPTGYIAKCKTDMLNQLSNQTGTIYGTDEVLKDVEEGSFVPYTSIITQTVNLEIIVSKGSGADASAWAVSTSDLYTRQIEYIGSSWDEE